jgi:hypothetical protein
VHPPFLEEPAKAAARSESNAFVKSFRSDGVVIIDVESQFTMKDGSIRFADKDGSQLYQDGDHLSSVGAGMVRASLLKTITGREHSGGWTP